jgi:hypothetical protein
LKVWKENVLNRAWQRKECKDRMRSKGGKFPKKGLTGRVKQKEGRKRTIRDIGK